MAKCYGRHGKRKGGMKEEGWERRNGKGKEWKGMGEKRRGRKESEDRMCKDIGKNYNSAEDWEIM